MSARTERRLSTDPRKLVQQVPMLLLIEAQIGETWCEFTMLETGDGATKFVCPRCSYLDYNGGSAVTLGTWRWSCHRCRFTGTRMMFERLVLEDDTALTLLYRFVNEGRAT